MARLNDPPAPVESVDGLKRRFIRQNRELARVNSTQSLRIRNLEAEISRLLTENISLREQTISFAQEAERWRISYNSEADILQLKCTLETKLREVSSLVTELGNITDRSSKQSVRRRTSTMQDVVGSPDQKEWKNKQSLAGVINPDRDAQEGRLPAILEDKHYPRKTLDSAEMHTLIDNIGTNLESPDLGPPPIAHFEATEPENSASELSSSLKSAKYEAGTDNALSFSRNLETRRKRRTSALLQDMSTDQFTLEAVEDVSVVAPAAKSGAKRKFDAGDHQNIATKADTEAGNFTFQRKSDTDAISNRKASRFVRQPAKVREPSLSPSKQNSGVRKVLASKSTNSPTKSAAIQNEKMFNMPIEKPSRHAVVRQIGVSTNEALKGVEVEECHVFDKKDENIELPPKTPAGLDLVSPTSAELSTKASHKQEMAMTHSVEDVLSGSIGRGSRRARAAVSYAEPNLRDKMRRPGKELVGAVEGIDKSKDKEPNIGPESVYRAKSETVGLIKKEKNPAEIEWKHLPPAEDAPSPLRDKLSRSPEEERSIGQEAKKMKSQEQPLEDAISRLSIFDPPTSSPTDSSETNPSQQHVKISRKSSVKSRRHSTLPGTLNRSASDAVLNARVVSSRPSSAASQRDTISKIERPDLKRPSSAVSFHASQCQESNGRVERMSARRKSMMT